MQNDEQFKDFGKVYQDKKRGQKGTIAGDAKSDFFKDESAKSGTIVNAAGFSAPGGAAENILDLTETS